MGKNRIAWVTVDRFTAYILAWKEENNLAEPGPDIGILMPLSSAGDNRKHFYIRLTTWTEKELVAVKKLFNLAFDESLEIVRLRDAEAMRSFKEEGNDSWTRLYRGLPTYAVRSRAIGEDGHIIWERLENAPEVDGDKPVGDERDPGGNARDSSAEVAERDEEQSSPENNSKAHHEH